MKLLKTLTVMVVIVFASSIINTADATCRRYGVSYRPSTHGDVVNQEWFFTSSSDHNDSVGKELIETQLRNRGFSSISVNYRGGSGGTNVCTPGAMRGSGGVVSR